MDCRETLFYREAKDLQRHRCETSRCFLNNKTRKKLSSKKLNNNTFWCWQKRQYSLPSVPRKKIFLDSNTITSFYIIQAKPKQEYIRNMFISHSNWKYLLLKLYWIVWIIGKHLTITFRVRVYFTSSRQ